MFRMNGRSLMVLSGVALLLLGTVVGRPYCRFLCPYGALLNTAPTTLAGCRALVEHVVAYAADEVGEDCHRTLVALAEVLQRRDRPAAA